MSCALQQQQQQQQQQQHALATVLFVVAVLPGCVAVVFLFLLVPSSPPLSGAAQLQIRQVGAKGDAGRGRPAQVTALPRCVVKPILCSVLISAARPTRPQLRGAASQRGP